MNDVTLAMEPDLSSAEFIALLNDSGLGARRPVDEVERIGRMLRGADLIVTARIDGALAGVARSVTDFAYCCYLSDLAVASRFKGKGIGKALIAETRRLAGQETTCLLLSAPDAVGFYEAIAMPRHGNAFMYDRER